MKTLDEAIREIDSRPTLHPYSSHKTLAGPIRHEVLEGGVGRVWVGMRKYGPVEIRVFEDTRPKRKWMDTERWKAVARYRRDKYSRDLMSAILNAWRC